MFEIAISPKLNPVLLFRWVQLSTVCAKCVAAVYAVAPHREAKRLQAKGLLQEIRQEASTMDEKGVSLQPGRKEQKEEDNNDNNHNINHARTTDCSTKIADEEKMFQEISQKVQEICDKMRLLVGAPGFFGK